MQKVLFVCVLATALVGAGQLTKFSDRPPVADYDSPAPFGEIERCLLDMNGWLMPSVYAQPDRPDDAILIWPHGEVAGSADYRIDLHRLQIGTHVRSWMPAKQVLDCAPK